MDRAREFLRSKGYSPRECDCIGFFEDETEEIEVIYHGEEEMRGLLPPEILKKVGEFFRVYYFIYLEE